MSRVILYRMSSDKNVYNKTKSQIEELQCDYKQPIDIVNPTVIIKGKFHNCNYIYLADFNRYYFVEKVTGLTDDIVALQCHCDVLSSNNITELTALVERQEFKRNTQLVDNQIPMQSNEDFIARTVGSPVIDDYNIYITTCGGGN